MEDKIRKFLKIILWVIFGGIGLLGIFVIIIDAFKNHDLFDREITTFLSFFKGYLNFMFYGLIVLAIFIFIQRWKK
jgi:hypothetical protein